MSILQTILHWIGLVTHSTGQMLFTPELKCWILIPWSELSCFALVLTASQEPLLLTLEQGVNNPQLTSALYLFPTCTLFQLFYFLSLISHLISSSHFLASCSFNVLTPLKWLHSLKSFHLVSQLAQSLLHFIHCPLACSVYMQRSLCKHGSVSHHSL